MRGRIEGYAGPMFSRKTGHLLERLRRYEIAGRRTQLFKPDVDTRWNPETVATHCGRESPAIVICGANTVDGIARLMQCAHDVDVVGVDEVQFFHPEIVGALQVFRAEGKITVWSGLDMDYRGHPFGCVPHLMAVGHVTKLTAVCARCGSDEATHTYRTVGGDAQIQVGATEYEARCFSCWRDESACRP